MANKADLKYTFQKNGIKSHHLDGIVHDAASNLASNANNEGIDGQINFLLDTCGWTSQDVLNAIKE